MERPFDIQIEKLKTKLIKMCSLVDEQVEFVIRAIEEENENLAVIVLERDCKVDKYDIKIERICQKIFALNQPVAMDLRLIMSAIKINANLERIGDLAGNIARNAIEVKKKPLFFNRIKFTECAAITREMIKNSIDSFIERDAELARKVMMTDDKLDELVAESRKELIQIMKEDKEFIEDAMKYNTILQSLERLGDHAVNITEEVYFIVKAESLKHKSLLLPENKDFDEY